MTPIESFRITKNNANALDSLDVNSEGPAYLCSILIFLSAKWNRNKVYLIEKPFSFCDEPVVNNLRGLKFMKKSHAKIMRRSVNWQISLPQLGVGVNKKCHIKEKNLTYWAYLRNFTARKTHWKIPSGTPSTQNSMQNELVLQFHNLQTD